jgi:hypothetical protein
MIIEFPCGRWIKMFDAVIRPPQNYTADGYPLESEKILFSARNDIRSFLESLTLPINAEMRNPGPMLTVKRTVVLKAVTFEGTTATLEVDAGTTTMTKTAERN